jgi:hypothetical protein
MNLSGSEYQGQAAPAVLASGDVRACLDGDVWGRLAVSTSGAYSLCLQLGTFGEQKRPGGIGSC